LFGAVDLYTDFVGVENPMTEGIITKCLNPWTKAHWCQAGALLRAVERIRA